MTHGPRRPIRGIEMAVTCLVHACAVAVAALAFSWQGSGDDRHRPAPQALALALHAPGPPHVRPKPAAASNAPTPAPLSPKRIGIQPDALLPPPQWAPEAPDAAQPAGPNQPPAIEAQAYRRALLARLEARRLYPDLALHRDWQGSGAVLFRIERSGRLLEASLTASTGHQALDKAALAMVQHAAPFPAIPDSLPDELAITLPVTFLIDHASGDRP